MSFIEPHYVDFPPDSFCDEPPSDIRNSQPFIRDLVEAVVAGPKWDKTLLLITYDEHGGFYDHVPPPSRRTGGSRDAADHRRARPVRSWSRRGCKGGTVFGSDDLHFDHTSILKTIARRFLSDDFPVPRCAVCRRPRPVRGPGGDRSGRPVPPVHPLHAGVRRLGDVPRRAGRQHAAGTPLWQFTPNGTDAQYFRFEDAGNGFVYIRTLAGLYLTAAPAPPGDQSPIGLTQERKVTGALRPNVSDGGSPRPPSTSCTPPSSPSRARRTRARCSNLPTAVRRPASVSSSPAPVTTGPRNPPTHGSSPLHACRQVGPPTRESTAHLIPALDKTLGRAGRSGERQRRLTTEQASTSEYG